MNFVRRRGRMKKAKGKNVRKIFWSVGSVITFLAILCGWRIWNVNHTKRIEKYKATTNGRRNMSVLTYEEITTDTPEKRNR